ncbi:hypothetical protein ACIPUD_14965 [Bradyrhizobium sp. CAR08]
MSRHLRFYSAGLVLVGVLAATPACSDPFTDLFNIAPREPAATSSVQPECLPRPGNSPGPRQHWVYRRDGHRKCWFLAEGTATVRKPAHGRVAGRATSLAENEAAQQRSNPMIDARVELLPSPPVDRAPPMPPAGELKVVDAAPFSEASKPALMPARPVADLPTSQLTPEHSVPPHVDVQKLRAAVRADSPAAIPMAAHNEVRDEPRSWTVTSLGVLLMTLGGFSILSSNRTVRQTVKLRHRCAYTGRVSEAAPRSMSSRRYIATRTKVPRDCTHFGAALDGHSIHMTVPLLDGTAIMRIQSVSWWTAASDLRSKA